MLKQAYARLVATMAALVVDSRASKAAQTWQRQIGRHHHGPIGNGHAPRGHASQRERANRRHARRAAKARR